MSGKPSGVACHDVRTSISTSGSQSDSWFDAVRRCGIVQADANNPLDPMEFRKLTSAAGDVFDVPEHIFRVDDASMNGWQLRYGEWSDFPDAAGGRAGAEKALAAAIAMMQFRIDTLGK